MSTTLVERSRPEPTFRLHNDDKCTEAKRKTTLNVPGAISSGIHCSVAFITACHQLDRHLLLIHSLVRRRRRRRRRPGRLERPTVTTPPGTLISVRRRPEFRNAALRLSLNYSVRLIFIAWAA